MAKAATATGTASKAASAATDVNAALLKRVEELEARERQRTDGVFTRDQEIVKTAKLHARQEALRQQNGPHLWNIIRTIRVDSREGKKETKEARYDFWTELDGGTSQEKVVRAWLDLQDAAFTGNQDDNPFTAELVRENARPENYAEALKG